MWKQFKKAMRGFEQRSRRRREYRGILAMDEHMLRDAGIQREDIYAKMRRLGYFM